MATFDDERTMASSRVATGPFTVLEQGEYSTRQCKLQETNDVLLSSVDTTWHRRWTDSTGLLDMIKGPGKCSIV